VQCKQPHNHFWQSPLLYDTNIWQTPASVRLLTFFTNSVSISELTIPFNPSFPLSTYTFSFRLLDDVDYWDPMVISEDWHMFLRCFFAKDGEMSVIPVYLPTIGEPVVGKNLWDTWITFYKQQLRHAWGALDISYVVQQWSRNKNIPFLKKTARLFKIVHDNMLLSAGAVFAVSGTILSMTLEGNPVVTMPSNFPYPLVLQIYNIVGAVGMISIWLVERFRCNNRHRSWRLDVLFIEIFNWVIFAFITYGLTSLPVLHAHTKLLLGDSLTYEVTPKGVLKPAGTPEH